MSKSDIPSKWIFRPNVQDSPNIWVLKWRLSKPRYPYWPDSVVVTTGSKHGLLRMRGECPQLALRVALDDTARVVAVVELHLKYLTVLGAS